MIKIFGKGLGASDGVRSTSASPVQTQQNADPVQVTRNTALFQAGESFSANSDPSSLKANLQLDGQLPGVTVGFIPPAIALELQIHPQVFSAQSGQVPFETLYNAFDLEIFPFYNFWVPDELTNDRDERGDRKFEDIPRFIKVSWLIAPDLPDPETHLPKRVNRRTIKPILFGREIERPNVFRSKGVDFSPEHLQPAGLDKIKAVIANGHVAPGVIEAVVDLPLHNASIAPPVAASLIDEDVFLDDPALRGVSVHELQGQQLQLSNGTLSSGLVGRDGISKDVQAQKNGLVDGKFNITKAPSAGGTLSIQSVHAASPVISLYSAAATPARKDAADNVGVAMDRISQPMISSEVPRSAQTKVKFFNPAIGGLVSTNKIRLMSAPEHLEMMASLAPSLPSLELLSRTNYHNLPRKFDIPSLPSPRVKPLEYVGYVIEKYRRGKTGVFVKVDEIDIPNREVNEYYDTKVLYGEVYRYRIRSILRWTRPGNVGIMGKDQTIIPKFGSHAVKLASHQSSYFYGEWSVKWAYGTCMDDQPPLPPDELQVRPESHRKRIVITFRLPENNQKDIISMRLFKKLQDENGCDLTDWLPMLVDSGNPTVDQPPANVIFFDRNVDFFQISKKRYVYCAQCVSRHGEDSVLSVQLAARLNKDFSTRGEYLTEMLSAPGVRIEYFGTFSTIPFQVSKSEVIISPPPQKIGEAPGTAGIVLTGRDAVGNRSKTDGNYIMRIQSLDTGESEDIPFDMTFRNLKEREIFVPKHVFAIPVHPEKKGAAGFQSKTPSVLQKALASYQDPKRLQVQKPTLAKPTMMAQRGERFKK